MTEIELYGPLSGKEGKPGFDDPEGQNTYMGDFGRVDRRVKKLPESFQAPLTKYRITEAVKMRNWCRLYRKQCARKNLPGGSRSPAPRQALERLRNNDRRAKCRIAVEVLDTLNG